MSDLFSHRSRRRHGDVVEWADHDYHEDGDVPDDDYLAYDPAPDPSSMYRDEGRGRWGGAEGQLDIDAYQSRSAVFHVLLGAQAEKVKSRSHSYQLDLRDSSETIPPSPRLSDFMMNARYFTVTTIIRDQVMSDSTPSTFSDENPRPCSGFMHSLSA